MLKMQLQVAQANTVKKALSPEGKEGSTGALSTVIENPASALQWGHNRIPLSWSVTLANPPLWEFTYVWPESYDALPAQARLLP